MKLFVIGMALAIALPAALFEYARTRFILNWDSSIPRGLYRLSQNPAEPDAVFCMEQQYTYLFANRVPPGPCVGRIMPVIKPQVRAKTIQLTPSGAIADGKLLLNTVPKALSASGHPIAHCPYGIYRPTPEAIWVFSSDNANSFDSRYFGPVSKDRIIAYARPVWTF